MKKITYIFSTLFLSLIIHSSAYAGFSISIEGKNVNLANPGQIYSGNVKKYNNFMDKNNNRENNINNNIIGTNDFNINMNKPLTTEKDIKRQAEKSCIILGLNNPNHEKENIIRAKCHMLNIESSSELPELKPILKNNVDDEKSLKKYKPHFEIGEIKVKETKTSIETPKEEKEYNNNVQEIKGDRSCDITRDLRLMLSPKCLGKYETKAQQNIGHGNYKDILNNNDVSKDITEKQDYENPKYLCHINFKEKVHHGFVQGYTSSTNQCIHSATLLNDVREVEIFDHMGYLIRKYTNRKN